VEADDVDTSVAGGVDEEAGMLVGEPPTGLLVVPERLEDQLAACGRERPRERSGP
jgi:hypothetical protein